MSAGETLADRVDGIVHEPTQVHDDGVDLTVTAVSTVAEPGRVDFGGGELEPAELAPVDTERRDPDDDYEWWHLDGGTYLIGFNESLAGDEPLLLRTRTELRERGAYHPTLPVSELGRVPLTVAEGGVRIKENARVSTLTPPP